MSFRFMQPAIFLTTQSSAGMGTREQAAAAPWTGTESLHDSTLRMLNDGHKRLRTPTRAPRLQTNVSLHPAPKMVASTGERLANARDKTSVYVLQQQDMTEEERNKFRKELKDKFSPVARPVPATLQGLTSLANERIDDAIARGLFKNIPRGKGKNVERDYNANSPFIDTTEYFMNKIIQKQDIVPPWIEKQQELIKAVNTFRSRLRNDWRRHAARLIASMGGSLDDQIRQAQSFALAEGKINPKQVKGETMTKIDSQGSLSTVTIVGKPESQSTSMTVSETAPKDAPQPRDQQLSEIRHQDSTTVLPMPYPFRDPSWQRAESAYHNLAIAEINDLTRSYNLMAPKIAQKHYYNLQRELNRCFAEVAPTLADEIAHRARAPRVKVELIGHQVGSAMDKFGGTGHVATIKDEDARRGYGFREFWKDLFKRRGNSMKT